MTRPLRKLFVWQTFALLKIWVFVRRVCYKMRLHMTIKILMKFIVKYRILYIFYSDLPLKAYAREEKTKRMNVNGSNFAKVESDNESRFLFLLFVCFELNSALKCINVMKRFLFTHIWSKIFKQKCLHVFEDGEKRRDRIKAKTQFRSSSDCSVLRPY